MKVLFLASLYAPYIGGGAEITLQNLVNALRKHGVEVVVLTIGPNKGMVEEQIEGVQVYRAGIHNIYFHHTKTQPPQWKRNLWHLLDIYNPFMKKYVRQVIKKEKPDVVSCHVIAGWSISTWDVLYEMNVPIVQVLHDQYLLCPRSSMFNGTTPCNGQCIKCRLMRILHPSRSNKVTAVIGVSRFILQKLLRFGYFSNTPIKEYIHNTRAFHFASLPVVQKNEAETVFGFIGTLAVNKGIDLLLATFIKTAKPHWRLKVAGRGKEEYESMLKKRFAHPQIEFLGYMSQELFFSTLDVSVVPSLCEDTFPGVVFESLQFGVPVIGSKRGGIPEMIVDGKSGVIFDPDLPHALSDAMNAMASNIDHYRSMKGQIQQNAAVFGDQDTWAKTWINVYERAIGSTRG